MATLQEDFNKAAEEAKALPSNTSNDDQVGTMVVVTLGHPN